MRDLEIQEVVQSSMKYRVSKKVSENSILKLSTFLNKI